MKTKPFFEGCRTPAPRPSAFTLIELLVVVTILAILSGLLLPTLCKAKAKAKSIACLNRLRQLQLAWRAYTDDHDDRLPPDRLHCQLIYNVQNWESVSGSWVLGNAQTDPSSANV